MIHWNVTKDESELIAEIVARAATLAPSFDFDHLEMTMDITAAHKNGCPLDLASLLAAEPFDFWHDVSGIQRHINRETGALEDCFLPRYADLKGGTS